MAWNDMYMLQGPVCTNDCIDPTSSRSSLGPHSI